MYIAFEIAASVSIQNIMKRIFYNHYDTEQQKKDSITLYYIYKCTQ